jgi:hypothetical protein
MCFISMQMTMKMDVFHQVITVERFMSMQGDGKVILKIQNLCMRCGACLSDSKTCQK